MNMSIKQFLNINLIAKSIIILLIFILLIIYFNSLKDFIEYVSNYKWYLEPAENENLVLSNFISQNSGTDIFSLISNGIVPIYPDLFHQISSNFKFDQLASLRLVSITFFILSQLFIIYFSKKIGNPLYLSITFAVLFFGNIKQTIYFLFARADSAFIFFGTTAIFILLMTYYLKQKFFYDKKYFLLVISGLFLGASILSKQTGIYFLIYSLFIIFYLNKKPTSIFDNLILILVFLLFLIFYYFKVNKYSLIYFLIGIKQYSFDFSFNMLLIHLNEILRKYFIYILLTFFSFISIYENKHKFYFWIWSFIIAILFSLKLFGNEGAFFNNFILLSSITSIFLIFNYRDNIKKFNHTILNILIVIGLLKSVYPDPENTFQKTYITSFIDNQKSNKKISNNNIFKFVRNNDGRYITGRIDNLLYYNNIPIEYESSVLSVILSKSSFNNNNKIDNSIIELKKKIEDNIKNQKYMGIIDGVDNNLILIFKSLINEFYRPKLVDTIFSGVHNHKITLYVKKE